MTGVLADVLAIVIGGSLGYLAKKIIPESWNDIILKGLGLVNIYVGITGSLEGKNTLVLIISLVIGAMIGEGLQIEQRFNGFSKRIERRFDARGGKSNFAQGFITASLMMCVGTMAIVGSLNAGLAGDNTLLYTKAAIDIVGALMFAASLGFGVIFAAGPVLIIEGGIVLLAGILSPLLSESVISEMTCAGSVLIFAMGLNLVADTKLKLLNYMPAVFLPLAVCPMMELISGLV